MAIKWNSHVTNLQVDPATGPSGGVPLCMPNVAATLESSYTAAGQIYYDSTNTRIRAYVNGAWATLQTSAGSGVTLDGAYDQGGAGAGRTITADTGAVAITVSNSSNNGALILTQNDTANNPVTLTITNAGTGNDITATNWNISKVGRLTSVGLTTTGSIISAGITDSGTSALTTLTATTGTITTLTAATFYNPAIIAAASGNTNLTIDAAGSGTITLGATSTGAFLFSRASTFSLDVTITNGNLALSAGTLSVTAGSGDGACITTSNLVAQSTLDLNVTAATTVAAGVIDIDASTGSAPILTMAFSDAYTGTAAILNMTNAVGAIGLSMTGAGTRTAHLITITDVPTTSAATMDLNLTMANAPAIDIDCAGTGNGGTIDIAYSAAFTGDAIIISMANAVGANCMDLTGSGTRTVPFITITDVPTTSAPTLDLNITPGAGVQAGIDIDVAGTQAADIIAIDFSAAFTGDALNITMTNGGAGAQAIVVDGSLANSGAIVSLSTSGISTANGSVLTCTTSTQPGAANTGLCARFLDTGAAQATSYAVQIDSTNNEALTVTTGRAHFVESMSSLASNRSGIVDNYVQAAGSANAITVAAITDAAGTTIPLVDGLVLVIDVNTRTLQAGANTLDYAGGGALSIVKSSAPTTNKAVAHAANGVITLIYSSGVTAWLDLAE